MRWLVLAALLFPSAALAAVTVIDVHYDVPGSDTKREWVQFSTDTAIPDIRTWRFLEGGVRHKIAGEGAAVPANTTFVLAADIPSFRADNPEYSGLVFDTAMSLSNSGETFSLLDASSTVVVSQTYVAAPKPAAEKPVAEKKSKAVAPKPEPRVLGATTTTEPTRAQLVAAAIEAPSREFAWVSFVVLGVLIVGGVGALFFLSRQ